MQNLLLSQIKASDKVMDEIKSRLSDLEYTLGENNTQDYQSAVQTLRSYFNSLTELLKDFETLITFSKMNKNMKNIDYELLKTSNLS